MSGSGCTIAAVPAGAVLPREEPGVVRGSDARLGAGSRDVSGAAPQLPGLIRSGIEAATPFADFAEPLPSGPRADLGWPRGLASIPHGLGQHPRQRQEADANRASTPAKQHRRGRGRYLGWPPVIKNGSASRLLRLGSGAAPVGPRCQWLHTTWPREARPGPRGAASLWACSQQAVILDPCPLAPRRAGSAAHALNPEPANAPAAPQNYPASGGSLLAWGLGASRPRSLG
jgi:hypothetical protein